MTDTLPAAGSSVLEHPDIHRWIEAFRRRGGVVSTGPEIDAYLASRGAYAVTFDAKTICLASDATRSSVFEEFIHAAQHRTGQFAKASSRHGTARAVAMMEADAAERLIRHRHEWSLPNAETRETTRRLREFRRQLERITG